MLQQLIFVVQVGIGAIFLLFMVDERHQNFDLEEFNLDRWIELVDGWVAWMDGWHR